MISENIVCLQPGARLRYVKTDENGSLNPKLPWRFEEGIEYGGLLFKAWDGSSESAIKLSDGTFSYKVSEECACNQVLFTIVGLENCNLASHYFFDKNFSTFLKFFCQHVGKWAPYFPNCRDYQN